MNIEDKARELLDSYRMILMDADTDCGNEILCTTIAKDCAMIAVNEILDVTFYSSTQENEYWKAVKQEIIKM
jgi:hypothetical protein